MSRRRLKCTNVLLVGVGLGLCAVVGARADDYPPQGGSSVARQAEGLVPSRSVSVVRDGDRFRVDIVMHIDVPLATVWEVLVDFSAMPRIVPNLATSSVQKQGDAQHLLLRQSGTARFGPFSKEYDSTREIELVPMQRIRAHAVAGTVKAMDSEMILSNEGANATRLVYHADVEPGFWLPPVVGPASMKSETAEQFSALLREMKRRHASGSASAPNGGNARAASNGGALSDAR
ncbi:SRPBCC family protein [Diaphorobacter aerolatus]|uniref:SRPBCC family protein n=1 Tax=Diaphorobacter aerolatus TaxID=1288495 RepID=A0A7H0GL73_9BURK|nr:SRPBCC family protein [Diaphorobacter aerolatus]QNP49039.1 SRPBCC family protein [Diaphorobacter aerolatus]